MKRPEKCNSTKLSTWAEASTFKVEGNSISCENVFESDSKKLHGFGSHLTELWAETIPKPDSPTAQKGNPFEALSTATALPLTEKWKKNFLNHFALKLMALTLQSVAVNWSGKVFLENQHLLTIPPTSAEKVRQAKCFKFLPLLTSSSVIGKHESDYSSISTASISKMCSVIVACQFSGRLTRSNGSWNCFLQ